MTISKNQQSLLKLIPGVDTILETAKNEPSFADTPQSVMVSSIRNIIDRLRSEILKNDASITEKHLFTDNIILQLKKNIKKVMKPNLMRTINATGVVVHTNLGRSLLSETAISQIQNIANRYSNLEFDIKTGKRGSRYALVEDIICEISGSESAMVVNNNAGAVLLCLDTISNRKEAIVSRGELVEIGGSFRIPDVMVKSGSILKEVGTTNRTHLKDYKNAINDNTGLLLKVHTSNYSVVGFTANVSLKEMVSLGRDFNIPVMEDLGSGTFIDFSHYGLPKEPTVQESIATGADIVTFSGDKLLGGPQAGIIAGKKTIIDKIKQNPLTRALRIDKLTLAALETTLRLYRDEKTAVTLIPTLNLLTMQSDQIEAKAEKLSSMLTGLNNNKLKVKSFDISSKAGGGSLPTLNLPSKCVGIMINDMTPNAIEKYMRGYSPPIIGRIENDVYIMDMRTVMEDELPEILKAISSMSCLKA